MAKAKARGVSLAESMATARRFVVCLAWSPPNVFASVSASKVYRFWRAKRKEAASAANGGSADEATCSAPAVTAPTARASYFEHLQSECIASVSYHGMDDAARVQLEQIMRTCTAAPSEPSSSPM